MLLRQPSWTCCCWLGVCFWLLTGERRGVSTELCRNLPCSRGSHDAQPPDRPLCQGFRCSGRANRSSHAFLYPTTSVRGQSHSKLHLSLLPQQQEQHPLVGRNLEHTALDMKSTRESCRGGGGGGGGGGNCTTRAPNGTAQSCKGIECRLALRIHQKPRLAGQAVPCSSNQGEGCLEPTLHRVAERAAQFVGEDLVYTASELGGATLGVQLTCDVKPGENEVPSEDALVLQLQLTKGQEKFVEALKSQQVLMMDLQQKLMEQQNTLATQQREIIEQQRKMYEQMDLIKVQYGMLFDTVKQMSFKGLQEDIQHYFEANLRGLQNQVRNHLQKSYSVHKVEVDAKVIDVREPLMDCGLCESDEFCNFQKTPSQCEKCTSCPAGFFQLSECSANADRICQDRDECIESPSICGEKIKCLNTPGGFRCLGIAEKEAALGLCGEEYFFNKELQECQACLMCEAGVVAFPCSTVSDTVCSTASENKLSESWAANLVFPLTNPGTTQVYPGFDLKIKGKQECSIGTVEGNRLVFKQHGLMWSDFNFAVKHSCRNFLQLSLKFNNSEEGYELSGVRIEQPEGKIFQSVSVSGAAEVEPSQTLSVYLRSPNQFCNQSKDLNIYDLNTPFSLFWLSHDTGAVAMTAQTVTAMHYQTSYRPTFKLVSVSDPYMLTLSHDGKAIKFTETGVVKFVFHQALYSMGLTCIHEGFSLVSFLSRNGTNSELMTVHKSGVNYRDTSISASGATRVGAGDLISFEILSPAQCNVRYFGDGSGISMLSLIWIPSAVSAALSASVSINGLPTGAVRKKLLDFTQISPIEKQLYLISTGQHAQKYFLFAERGVANVAFTLKLIHSCNMLQVSLNQAIGDHGQPNTIAQQVGGQMPEGSKWTSVSLYFSFEVLNGTMISISLDCVRGRVNHIAHGPGTSLSILWISS